MIAINERFDRRLVGLVFELIFWIIGLPYGHTHHDQADQQHAADRAGHHDQTVRGHLDRSALAELERSGLDAAGLTGKREKKGLDEECNEETRGLLV